MVLRKRPTRIWALEKLEHRRLMAGDVTASIESVVRGRVEVDVLVLVGDSAGNQVRVTDQGELGVLVQGLNGTTINGEAIDHVFEKGLGEVDLNNGDDWFEFLVQDDVQALGIVNISTGNGNDHVLVEAGVQFGTLNVDTGGGNDSVSLDYSQSVIFSGFNIVTGNGDDAVALQFGESTYFPFLGASSSHIDTGLGNDAVQFGGVWNDQGNTIIVNLGAGNDMLIGDANAMLGNSSKLSVQGGAGNDLVLNFSYFASANQRLSGFEEIES